MHTFKVMHPLSWSLALLGLVSIWISIVKGDFSNDWHYDVYTGRHFNELVTSPGSDIIETPAVLILYGSECFPQAADLLNKARPWGPSDKYMTLTFHDYSIYRHRVWYNVDETDDLKARYMTSDDPCLTALYFSMGRRLSNPVRFDPNWDFYQWIWGHMLVSVEVQNALPFKVVLKKEGQGEAVELATVETYASVTVQVHASMAITVYGGNLNLYYHPVEPYTSLTPLILTTELIRESKKTSTPDWLSKWREKLTEESVEVYRQQMYTAERYHTLLHHPQNINRYSDLGYMRMMLPAEIFLQITDFYHNYVSSESQTGDIDSEQNQNGDQMGPIPIPEDVEQPILEYVTKTFEKWCACELVPAEVATTSIQHYYEGSFINNHVNPDTTFTALLQIQTSESLDQSWPIEIVGFNGERDRFDLENGEVLFYEAGSTIFARPDPYEGKVYTCLYIDLVALNRIDESNTMYTEEIGDMDPQIEAGYEIHDSFKEEL